MKHKKKKYINVIVFAFAFSLLFFNLYRSSNKIIEELGEKSFGSIISSASYSAIDVIIEKGYNYNTLFDVSTDKDGNINMITSNSYEVNLLATKIANETYDFLDEKTKLGVNVPLGVFTGIRLISGYGKTIKMKLISTSSVKCEIRSEFTEAGINQTRHALYLDINCEVNIVTKINSKRITDKISVLVYDNLIIGKVPSVFINSQIIGEGYKNI